MNIIKEILNSPILIFLLGILIANFGWAINWELPYSQGVMLLRADINVFWFMMYITFLPILFILLYKLYQERWKVRLLRVRRSLR